MLRWAVAEMERRYQILAEAGVRNIQNYNAKIAGRKHENGFAEQMPFIVIIIDELSDLMMVAAKEIEESIARLAQMARAAGMHLVLATQRPSVDVITGVIKANFPARISFQVSSRIDSRTILDSQGAESLLGNGDMLYMPPATSRLERIHGPYITEEEIQRVVAHLKALGKPKYDDEVGKEPEAESLDAADMEDLYDPKYDEAVQVVADAGFASISYVQRRLRIGYNRAARIIERMEAEGVVGPNDGSGRREVLVGKIEQ